MAWDKDDAETVRAMVRHENDLINHRVSWLLTIQGFLFAALAFTWEDARVLVPVIAGVGVFVSFSIGIVIRYGSAAIGKLNKDWEGNKPPNYDGPDIMGHVSTANWERPFRPWRFLPVLFAFAWVATLCVWKWAPSTLG